MTIDTCLTGNDTVVTVGGVPAASLPTGHSSGRFDTDNCGYLNERIVLPMESGRRYTADVRFYSPSRTASVQLRVTCSRTTFTTPSILTIGCGANQSYAVEAGESAAVVFTAPSSGSFRINTCRTGIDTVFSVMGTSYDLDNCGVRNERSSEISMVAGQVFNLEFSFYSEYQRGAIAVQLECSATIPPVTISTNRRQLLRVPGYPGLTRVTWTVPTPGEYVLSTCESTVDTVITFDGRRTDADVCSSGGETVSREMQSGVTYNASISTYSSSVRSVWVSVNQSVSLTSPGTTAELAQFISVRRSSTIGTTNGAFDTAGHPAPDFWYSFVLTSCATVTLSLCDASVTTFDTILRLYERGPTGLQQLAVNDDYCGLRSFIEVNVSQGTFVIQVEGYGTSSGSFKLDTLASDISCSGSVIDRPTTTVRTTAVPQTIDVNDVADGIFSADGDSGGFVLAGAVCDIAPDCANGADEDDAICEFKRENPEALGAQATIPPRAEDADIAEIKSNPLRMGVNGVLMISFFILGTVAIAATSLYYYVNRNQAYDTTSTNSPERSSWEKYFWVRIIAKAWNLVWEFKAIPIIIYSFYAMLAGVLVIVASQELPMTCLQNVAEKRYNTSAQCTADNPELGVLGFLDFITGEGTCDGVGVDNSLSECKASLISEGKTKLYAKLIERNITGMRCSCTLEDEEHEYLSSVVIPFVAAMIVSLLLLVVEVVWESRYFKETFGTLAYFGALANAKRSWVYLTLLFVNILILVVSLIVAVREIENQVEKELLTTSQYNTAYSLLVSGYLLQLMAYTDLWARIPSSYALEKYKRIITINFLSSTGHPAETVGLQDVMLQWTWFLTAEDCIEMAEDGLLFHCLSEYAAIESPDQLQNEEDTRCFGRWRRDKEWLPKDIQSHDDVKPHVHGRYLAQRLNKRYWKSYTDDVTSATISTIYSGTEVLRRASKIKPAGIAPKPSIPSQNTFPSVASIPSDTNEGFDYARATDVMATDARRGTSTRSSGSMFTNPLFYVNETEDSAPATKSGYLQVEGCGETADTDTENGKLPAVPPSKADVAPPRPKKTTKEPDVNVLDESHPSPHPPRPPRSTGQSLTAISQTVIMTKASDETWGLRVDKAEEKGFRISKIVDGGICEKHGLKKGYLITSVQGVPAVNMEKEEIKEIMKNTTQLVLEYQKPQTKMLEADSYSGFSTLDDITSS
eukprot:m.1237226 g.1237226  ORF g.1237226 m.1237226 type:complete len:1201 (-) comp24668_c0_seq16:327-3929(-)